MSLNWRLLRVIRLRPFDTSTESGRADERNRRIALSAAASALAKVLSVGTALISIPLTLDYLGTERFGMWMTLSSLIAMLGFADLGVGNGVLTAVAGAYGRSDRAEIRRAISSGLLVLSGIALALLLLFAICYPWVTWHHIFNVSSDLAKDEAAPALATFVVCFAVAIPAGIVQRVQMGLQRSFMASLWQCVSNALGLVGVLLAIHLKAGLPWLVLGFMGAPLLAALLNSLLFFGRLQTDLSPDRHHIDRSMMRRVASTGALFLVLQVVVSLAFASDSLIISQVLGASAVAEYAVPEKLFSFITMCVVLFTGPLWPAYGEAVARGDLDWVRRTLKRTLLVALVFATAASLLLILTGPSLIRHWVGNTVEPTRLLLLALGLWRVLESAGTALAAFLNGAMVIRFQALTACMTAVLAIPLKIYLCGELGVPGVLFGTCIAWLTCTALPLYIYLRRHSILKGEMPSVRA